MMLISFFLFFLSIIVSFYIPGTAFTHLLKLKLEKSHAFIISWITGICFFLLITYLLAWVNASYAIFVVLLFFLIYAIRKKLILHSNSFKSIDRLAVLIILIGSFAFLSITFFSGMKTQEGLQFISVNSVDGMAHLARISNQMIFFPPQHPALSGVEFKGYHYFYDFLLSRFALFYHFSSLDLYFRFFPALISLLYGGGFYLISSLVTTDRVKKRIILFLAYFAQSAAFILIPLNKNYNIVQGGQLPQPIGLILDPSIVLSLAILLSGLFLLPKIKDSIGFALLAGLLLGVLSQVKIYTGIIGIACLIIYGFYILLRYKQKYAFNYLLAVIVTGILTATTYFPNNFGVGTLVFAPFLIYKHYMEQALFTQFNWETKRIIYAEHHNIIRTIQLYLQAFTIFWIVNLGIRIFPLIFIKRVISRKFWIEGNNIILLTMVLIPVIISSFFIQSISVFDILQFDWIVLALLSVPSGLVLGEIIQRKSPALKGMVIILFIIVITQNAYFISSYLFPTDKFVIPPKDIIFYEKVSEVVPQKSFIVTLVESDIPIVSALTGRSTYYERETISFPLDLIYNQRKNNLAKIKKSINDCDYKNINNQMSMMHTKYLIAPITSLCLSKSPKLKEYITVGRLAFYEFR